MSMNENQTKSIEALADLLNGAGRMARAAAEIRSYVDTGELVGQTDKIFASTVNIIQTVEEKAKEILGDDNVDSGSD